MRRDNFWPLPLLRAIETPARRRVLWALIAGTAIASLLEVVAIGLVFPVIAVAAKPDTIQASRALSWAYTNLGFTSHRSFVAALSALIAVVFLLKTLFVALLYWRQAAYVTGSSRALATRLHRGFLHLPLLTMRRRNSADLVYAIHSYSFGSWAAFLTSFVGVIAESFVGLAIGAMLIALQPGPTLVAGAAIALLMVGQVSILKPIYARLGTVSGQLGTAHLKLLNESFRAHAEIQVSGRAGFFNGLAGEVHHRLAAVAVKLQIASRLQPLSVEGFFLIAALAAVLVTLYSAADVAESLAGLALLVTAAFRLLPLLNRVQNYVNQLYNARHGTEILARELAGLETEETDAPRLHLRREIELSDVGVSYQDAPRPALAGVGLTIRRGESVGLIGRSGSGKTSLGNILLGLIAPTTGSLRVDGVAIAERRAGWRKSVAVVPQETVILDDTLLRNVAFGMPDEEIDRTRVDASLAAARLSDIPLETVLGENGARLSGGQKQRVGIARALYREVDLLVLDEPTSALDDTTEQELIETLSLLRGRTTMVLITHRHNMIALCDRVFSITDGRLQGPLSTEWQTVAEREALAVGER